MIERGGVKIAVIGQAFPYTPIANPRWMIPNWSFGIREEDLQANVEKARKARRRARGAAVAQRLRRRPQARRRASRASTSSSPAHTHDALPDVVKVGKTLLVASGSHGKFVSRLDLDVRGGEVKDYPLQAHPDLLRRDRAGRRDGREDRRRPRAAREDAGRGRRQDRDAAVPPRQLQRHARRRDLRRAAGRARRRDRAVAGLPLGQFAAARARTSPARTSTTPPRSPIPPPTA